MEIITTRSMVRQPPKVVGPTVTLLYTNEQTKTEKDEEGTDVTVFEYTQYRFEAGEYELIQIGALSSGAAWDDQLRAIEREHLYEDAEKKISKYTTDVPDAEKRDAWIAFKAGVRATPSQKTYPESVEYPSRPE